MTPRYEDGHIRVYILPTASDYTRKSAMRLLRHLRAMANVEVREGPLTGAQKQKRRRARRREERECQQDVSSNGTGSPRRVTPSP